MEHIKFPENSPSLIVIPSNKEGTGFLKYCYDERHLKGKIREDEFDKVVETCAKIAAKAYSTKRVMDRKGIGKVTGGIIALSALMTLAHVMLMLAAADAESDLLHYLSYFLLGPSFIAMTVITFKNWFKNVRTFITFEEITKNNLDNYFDKINRDKFIANGLEWGTAQLGHFWIELRIKHPRQEAFVQDVPVSKKAQANFHRQVSEENRLMDDNDEPEEKLSSRRSDLSELSDQIKKSHHRSASNSRFQKSNDSKIAAESISDDDQDGTEQKEFSRVTKTEAFQLYEDEKDFENFKKVKSSDDDNSNHLGNSKILSKRSKNPTPRKQESEEHDDLAFELEDLGLM